MGTYSSRAETQNELSRRLLDLAQRCEKNCCVTSSCFLTPAECQEAEKLRLPSDDVKLFLSGGHPECERKMAFFLPFFLSEEDLDVEDAIQVVQIRSFFGEPGHRRTTTPTTTPPSDSTSLIMASVVPLLLRELNKVGRCSVKADQISLTDVSFPERKTRIKEFTVKSMRLDAVAGNMFGISRSTAAELIRLGAVSLNYTVCEEPDAQIKANDVISVHGKGKGKISNIGGRSKKDRLFVEAEIYS